ncbi:hypothetical protein PENANT_c039G01097 [Penicillium antarcticum]|uniref:NAD(P)-binding protein n=1 Tax=Penicillium antarcticum TaxID=416450 RepID=A0A1V6PT02_9EURO|nr:uncharacterized protein N7508_008266 [Penicillium antarcticum]KAJ5298017.1 hypothetical protein N7508_008266 [Penicillium antarcticum]OQD80125.1 hypothetical protein PENANT_c039G01097 [Penicillium antarcticum]
MTSSPSTVLIIGASRGIGLQLVEKSLAKHPNAVIYATARKPATAIDLQKLHKVHPNRMHILQVDVTDASSIKQLKEAVSQTTSTLDQVIYNAGVLKGLAPLTAVGLDGLKENLMVNLFGAYACAMEFLPFVERSTYAKKVLTFIGSSFGSITTYKENFDMHNMVFGTSGVNVTAAYDISKTAVERLAFELDLELRSKGVPVLLIHPGLPKTDMNPMGNITVDDSAAGVINVIGDYTADREERFLDYEGKAVPL